MRNKIALPKMLQNSITGIIASALSTVSIYSIRIVISHVLGEEIYGINSIFISIVSALLILELGMSTAIIIILYKPVYEDDHEAIKSILRFFRNFYRFFCLFINIAGLVTCLFFLRYFVNTDIDFVEVQSYFMLYIISMGFKYLWSYKCCLLYANKKNSVVSLVTIINTIVFTVLQISCIYFFRNYWVYLGLYLAQNVCQNAFCNIYANKHYSYITENNVTPLTHSEKSNIVSIVRPMFIQRIANQIQDSSSVIIFGAIGTSAVTVGFFSNYIFVVHACQTLFNQVGASFTTSYGNYSAKSIDIEDKFNYYSTSRFFMSWVATIFATSYLCLIQDFIRLFFGKAYCMTDIIAVLLACYVFVVLDSAINLSTQNAVGAHYLDTKEIICQALIGIALSVVLGKWIGAVGISISMIVSVGIFTGIIKGIKIIKNIYNKKAIAHICLLIKEISVFVLISFISLCFYRLVLKPTGIVAFVLAALAVFVLSNVLFLIINIRSKHMSVVKSIVRKK